MIVKLSKSHDLFDRTFFVKNIKKRLLRISFCIGISQDQITPVFVHITRMSNIQSHIPKARMRIIDTLTPNTFSLQTSNYGKRAKQSRK